MTPRPRRSAVRTPRDLPVWRYVSYPLYLELLRKRALHFTRVDQLDADDPHEGRFLLPEEWAQAGASSVAEPAREHFAVSCWCAADGERTSLWERYASPYGVALKSRVSRLREALGRHAQIAHVGEVSYEEDRALRREGGLDILRWMLRKRRAFEDEQEIRAVLWSMRRGSSGGDGTGAWPRGGADVPVNPDLLIEEVWVGPPWEPWFHEQVRDVSERLGFDPRKVRRSTLMDSPPLADAAPPPPRSARRRVRRSRGAARSARATAPRG